MLVFVCVRAYVCVRVRVLAQCFKRNYHSVFLPFDVLLCLLNVYAQYPSVLNFMLQIKPSVEKYDCLEYFVCSVPLCALHLCPLCMLSANTSFLLVHDLPTKTPKLSHVLLSFKPSRQTWTQCMPKCTLYNANARIHMLSSKTYNIYSMLQTIPLSFPPNAVLSICLMTGQEQGAISCFPYHSMVPSL
jgi:hypothetical protein